MSFLKRKCSDMPRYRSAARNAPCFFASASRIAKKCDKADDNTLKQIAAANFERQRAAIQRLAWTRRRRPLPSTPLPPYASAAADTARRCYAVATAATVVCHDALQDARQHLANAATIVATCNGFPARHLFPVHRQYARFGRKPQKLQCDSRRGAHNLLVNAIIDVDNATEAVVAADAKEAKIRQDETRAASMLESHQALAKEYTADALKIQQQMEDLIAEREYADKADFDILASLIADSSRSGKRCCTAAGADAKV
jgi:hypothetical protein